MAKKPIDAAVADFAHSVGLLVRCVRAAAASDELSMAESSVLRRLTKDGPATTAELARVQGMRPQSMRPILATLEKLEMITRKPHATDGRQVNIHLTARGVAEQKSSGDAKQSWLEQAIAQLDADERKTLFVAGKIMKRLARAAIPKDGRL